VHQHSYLVVFHPAPKPGALLVARAYRVTIEGEDDRGAKLARAARKRLALDVGGAARARTWGIEDVYPA
jgi:hypothetical protein